MTSEHSLNLAGVVAMLEMEESEARMRAEMNQMRERADRMEQEILAELERLRGAVGGEIVLYGAYDQHGLRRRGGEPEQEPTEIEVKRRTKS